MQARLRYIWLYLREAFWVIPALLVLAAVILGWRVIRFDELGDLPDWLKHITYAGGAAGARGLLSALATSSLSVAGTIFSITIAALSLAAGQMGPRVLRNFTRDRGNQLALGVYLGTFAYSLIVLRSVRGASEGDFVPQVAVTLAFLLGLACTAMLVWFVHHAAASISVDVVIDVVCGDLREALNHPEAAEPAPPPDMRGAAILRAARSGFLQQLDASGLADFAADAGCTIQLLFRPGQRVHCGIPIALIKPEVEGANEALRRALVIGASRTLSDDPEFAVQQLTDLAVRALSPGINDPGTACSVVDTLTSVLCEQVDSRMLPGHVARGERILLCWPALDYPTLVDSMFNPIRLNAARSPSVVIEVLKGLTQIAQAERDPHRLNALRRHAELARATGFASTTDPAASQALSAWYHAFGAAFAGIQPVEPQP